MDDEDREMFLRTMGEAAERSGWKVYGWVLMDNHYHWAIETPEPNLVAGMKWFQNTYTRRFNTRHGAWGHLFGGRYKAIPVEGAVGEGSARGGDYLAALLDYIHLNPVRAGLIFRGKAMSLVDYPWSSLSRGYALPSRLRKPWMAATEGLMLFGFEDRAGGRLQFIKRLEERALEGSEPTVLPTLQGETRQTTLDRGWYWGGEAFREKLLSLLKKAKVNRNYRSSPLGRDQNRRSAEEWIAKGEEHFGIKLPVEGRQHRAERVAIAWAVHRKTNQPQAWIAETLGLRTAANVSQQVRRFQKAVAEAPKPTGRKIPLLAWVDFVNNC